MTSKTPDWVVPGYPPLKDDLIGKAAVEGQLVQYPNITRGMVDPPLSAQKYNLISFMLFSEPRKLRNGKPVYGFVKSRGNWSDEIQARSEAAKLIREYDSKYVIRIALTGHWVPITEEEAFVEEKVDVRMTKDELLLRDEAAKEKEADQRRIQREIREREEELKSEGDIYDDKESLKYYSMRRVTELRLMEQRDIEIKKLENIRENLKKVQKETKKIEHLHPGYLDEWIGCYNEERRRGGIPDYVPSEDQEKEHASATADSDEESSSKDEE